MEETDEIEGNTAKKAMEVLQIMISNNANLEVCYYLSNYFNSYAIQILKTLLLPFESIPKCGR